MADIAKCTNENCSKKDSCLRYTIKADIYNQSYAEFDEESCNYFIATD